MADSEGAKTADSTHVDVKHKDARKIVDTEGAITEEWTSEERGEETYRWSNEVEKKERYEGRNSKKQKEMDEWEELKVGMKNLSMRMDADLAAINADAEAMQVEMAREKEGMKQDGHVVNGSEADVRSIYGFVEIVQDNVRKQKTIAALRKRIKTLQRKLEMVEARENEFRRWVRLECFDEGTLGPEGAQAEEADEKGAVSVDGNSSEDRQRSKERRRGQSGPPVRGKNGAHTAGPLLEERPSNRADVMTKAYGRGTMRGARRWATNNNYSGRGHLRHGAPGGGGHPGYGGYNFYGNGHRGFRTGWNRGNSNTNPSGHHQRAFRGLGMRGRFMR